MWHVVMQRRYNVMQCIWRERGDTVLSYLMYFLMRNRWCTMSRYWQALTRQGHWASHLFGQTRLGNALSFIDPFISWPLLSKNRTVFLSILSVTLYGQTPQSNVDISYTSFTMILLVTCWSITQSEAVPFDGLTHKPVIPHSMIASHRRFHVGLANSTLVSDSATSDLIFKREHITYTNCIVLCSVDCDIVWCHR